MNGALWEALGRCFLPAALVAFGLTALVRAIAPRWGFVDHPAERKSHAVPIPLGGGIAVALAMLIVLACCFQPEFTLNRLPLPLVGGGIVLLLLGAADDRFGLPWQTRLCVHFVCALAASYAIDRQSGSASNLASLMVIAAMLTLLINSYNMLDNIDALAGGTALCAALNGAFLGFNSAESAQTEAIVLLTLAGAIAGFLVWNYPPASIFLGDAGSYWIGYFTAWGTIAVCLATNPQSPKLGAMLAVLFNLLPLYDTTTVIAVRLCERRSPFQADRCHASHRLVERGFSKRAAAAILVALAAVIGMSANTMHFTAISGVPYLFTTVLLGTMLVGVIDVRSFLAARRKQT